MSQAQCVGDVDPFIAEFKCNEPRGGHDLSHTKNEQTRSVDGII